MKLNILRMVAVGAFAISLAACGGNAGQASNDTPTEPAAAAGEENTYAGNRVEDRIPVPDWLPSDIYLPDDYEATQAVDIGTGNYTLRGISQLSQAELLEAYQTELASSGYNVRPPRDADADEPFLVFGGNGVSAGGVRIRDDGDRREIQMNFTKRGS